jgi:hypothetical protein
LRALGDRAPRPAPLRAPLSFPYPTARPDAPSWRRRLIVFPGPGRPIRGLKSWSSNANPGAIA